MRDRDPLCLRIKLLSGHNYHFNERSAMQQHVRLLSRRRLRSGNIMTSNDGKGYGMGSGKATTAADRNGSVWGWSRPCSTWYLRAESFIWSIQILSTLRYYKAAAQYESSGKVGFSDVSHVGIFELL